MAKASEKEMRDALTLMAAARQTGAVLDAFLEAHNQWNRAMAKNIAKIKRQAAIMDAAADDEDTAE